MPPVPCMSPCCRGCGAGRRRGVGALQAQSISPLGTVQGSRTASVAAGRVAIDTSAAGWPCRSSLRAPLSLQAFHGAAAAQLPPALCVLHGDRGPPLHVRLRILPGQHLDRLRGWHARRRQLCAWAPLCHWQWPQEEAASTAAGPGEPRREGDESCGGPQLATSGLCPWAAPKCGCAGPWVTWSRRWGQCPVPAHPRCHGQQPLCHTMPCHAALCHTVLSHTVLSLTMLSHTVP